MTEASAASTRVVAAVAAARLINIAGVDKDELTISLLVGAKLSQACLLKPQLPTDVSQGMARHLSTMGRVIGWYCGRALMVDISGDMLDPTGYDQYNGSGAAARAVRRARAIKRAPKATEAAGHLYVVTLDGWRPVINDPQGVCVLADVHFMEHGVAQKRVIGFGRVAGHLPTFWMRAIGADMSRFVWQAVGRAVTSKGMQESIHRFTQGKSDPGEIRGSYQQSTKAYDPHVTLFPGRSRGSWNGDYQKWAPIDRILDIATFDVIPSPIDADCMYLCLRHLMSACGKDFVTDTRDDLDGNSLLGAYRDAMRLERDPSAVAMLQVLMVAVPLVVESLED